MIRFAALIIYDVNFWSLFTVNTTIDGYVTPGFESVADVFRDNFLYRKELGAAVALYRGSECLVDLWGGIANSERAAPWQRDTTVLMYSTAKGITGLTLALAHSRGLFDYDDRVARYWPEFSQQGKQDITIRQLLCHQAGLAVIDEMLTLDVLKDADRRDAILASQMPAWTPGEQHGYHTTSFGFYATALLRRCDKQGRGVSQFFDEEIARPLGIRFWLGLPQDYSLSTLARIQPRSPWAIPNVRKLPLGLMWKALNPRSYTMRSFLNPRVKRAKDLDSPAFWHLEHPSSIGVGEPRAVARAYSEFASGGATLGIKPETLNQIESLNIPPRGTFDLVMRMEKSYSLGFTKPTKRSTFGSSSRAYGTAGMGGSFGFADPDLGIGFAYAPNRLGSHVSDDPREKALRDAVYRCLQKQ